MLVSKYLSMMLLQHLFVTRISDVVVEVLEPLKILDIFPMIDATGGSSMRQKPIKYIIFLLTIIHIL